MAYVRSFYLKIWECGMSWLWLLTQEQEENCLSVASLVLECTGNDEYLFKNVLTDDEMWIYIYDPKNKQ